MIEPDCHFCKRKLVQLTPFQSRGKTVYSCYCIHCRSEQVFTQDGEPQEYSFRVGQYVCIFNSPRGAKFEIANMPNPKEPGHIAETLFKLNFIPDLTPQNTTEDRIKTLILFS